MSDHLPESFSLASILAEQGLHHQEGLLSQNDWLKITQRDGMGREEGGGFRMGNTCIPVADSF